MSENLLRESLIKLAHEKPELRKHLVPLLRGSNKEASYFVVANNYTEILQDLWTAYKEKHEDSKRPPPSLREEAEERARKEYFQNPAVNAPFNQEPENSNLWKNYPKSHHKEPEARHYLMDRN